MRDSTTERPNEYEKTGLGNDWMIAMDRRLKKNKTICFVRNGATKEKLMMEDGLFDAETFRTA